MNVAVIIPAYNEEESIAKVLDDIPKDLVDQVIVADNGSTDNTAEVARRHGAVVADEQTRGYGFACLAGLKLMNDDIDTVVFLDGDYSDHPEEMELLLKTMEDEDCDIVIGSRITGNRAKDALPIHSVIGNFILAGLFTLLYQERATDIGPFRVIKRSCLDRMNMTPAAFRWTVEMMVKAVRMGLRMKEIPVSYRKRIGKSKVTGTIKGTFLAAYYIISTMFMFLDWNEQDADRSV